MPALDFRISRQPMRDQAYFNVVAAVAAVLVLLAAGIALVVAPAGTVPAGVPGPGYPGPTVYRNLTISYDPSAAGFAYGGVALEVPLNVRVIFSITNLDSTSATLPTLADAEVVGTDGGGMQIVNEKGSSFVTSIPSREVSHTFSLSDAYYHLNVPVPATDGAEVRSVVSFYAIFAVPGTYAWGCVVLCGEADMHLPGLMYGTLTVS